MEETLVEYKLSDLLKSNRNGSNRLQRSTNRKQKNRRRRNNRMARKNRRSNLRRGNTAGKQ